MTNTPENNRHAMELLDEMCKEDGVTEETYMSSEYDYIDKD